MFADFTVVRLFLRLFLRYIIIISVMGRPKSKIGRKHKNYEKIRQSMKKNVVGRPRKIKNVVS